MGDAGSLKGDDAAVETFSSEIVKGVLPSRHVASDVQAGVPYFLRLTASNSLGYGEYGDTTAVAKAAKVPGSPGNLSAGVALHVDEVSQPLCSRVDHMILSSQVLHLKISLKPPSKIYAPALSSLCPSTTSVLYGHCFIFRCKPSRWLPRTAMRCRQLRRPLLLLSVCNSCQHRQTRATLSLDTSHFSSPRGRR